MADFRQAVTLAAALILIFSLLSSWRRRDHSPIQQTQNATELNHKLYRGHWSSDGHALGLLSESTGRAYFAAEQVDINNFTAYFVIFDGLWEDDQAYTIMSHNSTFEEASHTMYLGNQMHLIDHVSRRSYSSNSKAESGDGQLFFTSNEGLFEVEGMVRQNDTTLDFDLEQMTEDAVKEGKFTYSVLYTCINFVTFLGFIWHLRHCLTSESYAKQTSLLFLGMNACIDLFLTLWHLRLAMIFINSFDYLILASLWSLTVFLIVQGKLAKVVWQAQNPEISQFVMAR